MSPPHPLKEPAHAERWKVGDKYDFDFMVWLARATLFDSANTFPGNVKLAVTLYSEFGELRHEYKDFPRKGTRTLIYRVKRNTSALQRVESSDNSKQVSTEETRRSVCLEDKTEIDARHMTSPRDAEGTWEMFLSKNRSLVHLIRKEHAGSERDASGTESDTVESSRESPASEDDSDCA